MFTSNEKFDDPPLVEPQIPASLSNIRGKKAVAWTEEEDQSLMFATSLYKNNWSLISEHVKSRVSEQRDFKSPWDCWSRFQHIHLSRAVPSNEDFKMSRNTVRQRASRHMQLFDSFSRVLKKRDNQKNNATPKQKINPNTHVSHQAISARAGVDPRRYRTPLEHNDRKWKLQRMAEVRP